MKWIHSDGQQRKVPVKALSNTFLSLFASILPNSLRKPMESPSFEKMKSISCFALCNTLFPYLPEAPSGFSERHTLISPINLNRIPCTCAHCLVWLPGHNLSAAHCTFEEGLLAPGLAIDNCHSRVIQKLRSQFVYTNNANLFGLFCFMKCLKKMGR